MLERNGERITKKDTRALCDYYMINAVKFNIAIKWAKMAKFEKNLQKFFEIIPYNIIGEIKFEMARNGSPRFDMLQYIRKF